MAVRTALLTGSATAYDSRIRRTLRALGGAAYLGNVRFEVTLLSPDENPPADVHGHMRIEPVAQSRADLIRNLLLSAPATLLPALALPLHRQGAFYKAALAALIAARPDIIHANDWITLPAAMDAARLTGARVIYDTHEMAISEHADRRWWRWLAQPCVAAIEGQLIGKVDHVITVSDGIAGALKARYGTQIRALDVVRNLPEHVSSTALNHTSDRCIRLCYAGLIRPERRIDVMIGALAHLPPDCTLTITGFGAQAYIAQLQALAAGLGVASRLIWQPPVPPDALVAHLTGMDIGLFLSDGAGPQQRFALPNKVFEYMAAGAGVIASGSADVEALLTSTGCGFILDECTPQALAKAVCALSRQDIQRMQRAAIGASEQHSWVNEQQKLLAIYNGLVQPQALLIVS